MVYQEAGFYQYEAFLNGRFEFLAAMAVIEINENECALSILQTVDASYDSRPAYLGCLFLELKLALREQDEKFAAEIGELINRLHLTRKEFHIVEREFFHSVDFFAEEYSFLESGEYFD